MAERQLYPRPEYPRPERQRGTREGYDWLNLNGPWEFRFDSGRSGVQERWFEPSAQLWREQIIVPFCWESLAAWGEGESAGNESYYSTRPYRDPLTVDRTNYRTAPRYEVGWYRRQVWIPANEHWRGRRVILTVGAADFFTDCWCNGTHLGRHEGGYTPFEFDLTDALRRDPATGQLQGQVVFRVEDPMDNREQPVGKQWRWYTPSSGIWQTALCRAPLAPHIDSFRVVTDIDAGSVHFEFECHEAERMSVLVQMRHPNTGALQETAFEVRKGLASGDVKLEDPSLWDPNHPHLYETTLTLQHKGGREDHVLTYFGMRKIDSAPAEDPKAPAVLSLQQPAPLPARRPLPELLPRGRLHRRHAGAHHRRHQGGKEFGFNFLRVHIKIDDPQVYYWADKLGVLIMADFPNFGEGGDTQLGHERFERMMRQAIRRDFNHPCIFAWCLFNETWGFGGQVGFVDLISPIEQEPVSPMAPLPGPQSKLRNLASHAWVRDMWDLAKSLDSTRLIEDMSVCHWGHLEYFLHGNTDINSWHFYSHDYEYAKKHISTVVENTYKGSEFNYVPGYSHGGEPLINSEYGGVGALDGDRDVSWSFKFLTNELRRHGAISAYIYTELTDLEWEYNGFLNYDRSPKKFGYDPRTINAADQLPINAPPIQKVAPGETVVVPIASSHYSVQRKSVTLRWRMSGLDGEGRLHQDLLGGEMPIDFPHRRVVTAARLELQMPDFPVLATLSVEAVATDGAVLARNFIELLVSAGYPPPFQEGDRSAILRLPPWSWADARWRSGMTTRRRARPTTHAGHGLFPGARWPGRRRARCARLCEVSLPSVNRTIEN
jgi:hypothetical protein